MAITVELPVFDGPLDLLLHLIGKNKINIFDIPIAVVTEQYLAYVQRMQEADMDVASEFMVMAAELFSIKCRMLLPPEENGETEEADPRKELVRRLLEYKIYRYMSGTLRERLEDAGRVYFKKDTTPKEVRSFRPAPDPDELLEDLTLARLREVFRSVLKRREDQIDPIRSRFGKIRREVVHLRTQAEMVAAYAKEHRRFSFRALLRLQKSRMHVIVTLLAVLQMIKSGCLTLAEATSADDVELACVEGADFSAFEWEWEDEKEEDGDGKGIAGKS